jgi:hypothetical protein
MKQTAVEWYCNEMESLRVNAEINNMDAYKFIIRRAEIFEQAKEMEKEQIEELVIATYTDLKMKDCQLPYGIQYHNELLTALEEAKKYYNETFKQQEQ